jgi:hypothetical protein
VLLVKLDREILKVHAGRRQPRRICAPERAVSDRQASLRLDRPDTAHDLNPDIAAKAREELDHLRVTLPQGHVMRSLRIGLVHISLRQKPTRSPTDGALVAALRQRTCSDHDYPDPGQEITWKLCWQHTTMLIDDRRGNCVWNIAKISHNEAGQISAEPTAQPLAARRSPAALGGPGLPGVTFPVCAGCLSRAK